MDLLCKQIGLNVEGEARITTSFMIRTILKGLRGYTDNGPIGLNGPSRLRTGIDAVSDPDYEVFMKVLNTLANNKILLFIFPYPNYKGPSWGSFKEISVFVTNRYKLELLYSELKWLGEPKDKRSEAPHAENLVYYDVKSGRGMVNGNKVYLKGRNRKLFNVLFSTAPNTVDKKSLEGIARLGHKSDSLKYAMNDSFSLVRKACKVDNTVIVQQSDSAKLNAKTYPLSIQQIEYTFEVKKISPKIP
jgi:hypothetical protein